MAVMNLDTVPVVDELVTELVIKKAGRPPVPEEQEVLTNGLARQQWEWIKREAKSKGIHAAQYQRFMIQCFIDSVEASRNGSPATQKDDKKYERLIKQSKLKKKIKSNHKIKRR